MNTNCCETNPFPGNHCDFPETLSEKVAERFQKGTCGLWIWDSEINQLEVFGEFSPSRTLEDWVMKIHPRDHARFSSAIHRASEGESESCEYRIRNASSDSWTTIRQTFAAKRSKPSKVHAIIELISDETKGKTFNDLEEAEKKRSHEVLEQLQQAQKLASIGKLASGVAHDFNNSLTVIQGHLLLLEMAIESLDREQSFESLELLKEATEQASGLSRQLLMLGRQSQPNLECCDLHPVISNFVRMMERIMDADISFEMDLSADSSEVKADSVMIGQILMNLIVNARDAMNGKGKVRIATQSTDESRFCLKISDSGPGIPAEHLEKIFTPFFSTKERSKGTGLGLANVASIVKEHRGTVCVEETSESGTTFKIELPLARRSTERKKQPSPETTPRKTPLEGTKILLVEDENAVRKLVRKLLEMLGCTVVEAASGRQALDLWPDLQDDISLVISDVVMPEGVSGWDLAKELHRTKPDLGILLTSGYCETPEEHDLGEDEQVAFLQKPYESNRLKATLSDLLENH